MQEDDRSLGRRFASDIREGDSNFNGFDTLHYLAMAGIFLAFFIIGVLFYKLLSPLFSGFAKSLTFFGAIRDMFKFHFIGATMFLTISLFLSYLLVYRMACKRPLKDRHSNLVDRQNFGGTSRDQTPEVLRETYELTLPSDYKKGRVPEGIIFGQMKTGKHEILSAPWSSEKIRKLTNQNIWVTGMSGSGKTKYFLLMLIFQSILDGMNITTTDPKGEEYSESAAICLHREVDMYIFNIDDPENSDAVDILKSVRESTTPEIMADALVELLLKASREKKGVGFFEDTNANLLYLACLYVARAKSFVPYEISNSKSEIKPAGYNPSDMGTGLQYYAHRTFDEVCRLITSVSGTDITSMEERIRKSIESDPDDRELLMDPFNIWTGHAKTKDDTQSSTAVALKNIVQNRILRKILSEDEIDFNKVLTNKSALFIIMPAFESPYANVIALLFDFLMKAIDKVSKQAGGEMEIRHRLIFEELSALSRLSALKTFVAMCRSKGAGAVLCTQSLEQGASIYPDGEFGDIINNCAVQICKTIQSSGISLDTSTADYFSARSGEYGAIERMSSYERGVFGSIIKKGESERIATMRVITRDDIFNLKIDECVLASASHKGAVMIDSLFFKDHPAYKVKLKNKETGRFEKPNAINHIPKWRGGKTVNDELKEKYEIIVLTDDEVEALKEKEYNDYLRKGEDGDLLKTTFDEII